MYCRECGTELQKETKYCPKCGAKVLDANDNLSEQNNESTPNQESLNKNHNDRNWMIVTVIGILAVFIMVGMYFSRKEPVNDNVKAGSNAIDLYEYRVATEEVVTSNLSFTKNDLGLYPTENDFLIMCAEGSVYSISISEEYKGKYTFLGISPGDTLEDGNKKLDGFFTFVEKYTCTNNEFRNVYYDNQSGFTLVITYDMSSSLIKSISYANEEVEAELEDETPMTTTVDEVNESTTTDGNEISESINLLDELSVLEENGFNTNILYTPEQIIVSYAKFLAISYAGIDDTENGRTMAEIENELYEYGYASNLNDYNSYEILNYYLYCEIYNGLEASAANVVDTYDLESDAWTVIAQVNSELDFIDYQ